jgi:hypothetical protein
VRVGDLMNMDTLAPRLVSYIEEQNLIVSGVCMDCNA